MSNPTSTERRLRAQVAANTSWANTPDRSARTAAGRRALEDRFLAQADGDPQRAASLRKAHFQRLALKSAQSRRRAREAARAAQSAEADVDDALDEFHGFVPTTSSDDA